MSSADAQKSEVHAATADASTSPTAAGDETTTKQATGHGHSPADPKPRNPTTPADLRVVLDDTDNGGPLVIKSDDPALNPPRVPSDPFPTERTPEIDPPVEKK